MRPHTQRLLHNLDDIRKEFTETVSPIEDDELDWAPADGMKSYRALLQEIGAMEKLCTHWLANGGLLEWDMSAYAPSATTQSALRELGTIRDETRAYLQNASEEKLETLIDVPADWQQYMGPQIEPEEVVRWIGQHEYYHLGQIISYRWAQGHSPYGGATAEA